jgi:hypothetical protein
MKRRKTITLPDEEFDRIKLGVQERPNDPRIFKGSMSAFFDAPIVESNNAKDTPDRFPLDTCPVVDEAFCCFCISYDGDNDTCTA